MGEVLLFFQDKERISQQMGGAEILNYYVRNGKIAAIQLDSLVTTKFRYYGIRNKHFELWYDQKFVFASRWFDPLGIKHKSGYWMYNDPGFGYVIGFANNYDWAEYSYQNDTLNRQDWYPLNENNRENMMVLHGEMTKKKKVRELYRDIIYDEWVQGMDSWSQNYWREKRAAKGMTKEELETVRTKNDEWYRHIYGPAPRDSVKW